MDQCDMAGIDLWEGEPEGIRIQTHSVMYFVGLPPLGSPLVISDPSVATYDLLTLAHIIGRWVETMCNSSKSIRITNI